jgi:hypothetical protein
VPPNAGTDLNLIGLDPLPSPTTVASLAALQLGIDRGGVERDAGGKPINQGNEGLSMRFASGPVTKHFRNP